MSEALAEKVTWRSWAATALNEANQGDLAERNVKALFGVFETLTAVIIMYCNPGEVRQEALDKIVDAYRLASGIVDPSPVFPGG